MNNPGLKDNLNPSPMQRFWRLIAPDKKEIRNIYVYAIFFGLVNLSLPIGIQAIINQIQGGQLSTSWIVLVVLVITGVALAGIMQIKQLQITEHLQQKIFTRAAFEFAYRIPRIKLIALYEHYAPELMNRFFDVISVQKGLSKVLLNFTTASITTIFGLILLSLYHPFFIAFSLILILVIFAIFKFTSKKGLESSLKESKNKYAVAHWLEELAKTSATFKLVGQTELPLERTNQVVGSYINARDEHFVVLYRQYILMVIFKVLVAAGLLIVGSLLVMDQQMNIGQFVAAEIIILLVMNSVEKLILSLETIYDLLTSLEKIGQVTDLELDNEDGIELEDDEENTGLKITLKDVQFSYPNKQAMFTDASLTIQAGERIVILGSESSGKKTLLHLMAGLYPIQGGNISFNDIPFGNLAPHYLWSIIGDCLTNETLFDGTLLENIGMGHKNATFKRIQWAVEALGLTPFVQSLPNGYDTVISPRGKHFSKNTIDKLVLARCIAMKPKLILINDTFSSLVGEDRKAIFKFLTDKKHPWTVVIATRDTQLTQFSDRVIRIAQGQLNEVKR